MALRSRDWPVIRPPTDTPQPGPLATASHSKLTELEDIVTNQHAPDNAKLPEGPFANNRTTPGRFPGTNLFPPLISGC